MRGRKTWTLVLGVALVAIGLGGLAVMSLATGSVTWRGTYGSTNPFGGGRSMMGSGPDQRTGSGSYGGMMRGSGRFARVPRPATFSGNGDLIYFTGLDDAGVRVGPTLPMAQMMGLACADCHGADRKGGILMPDGTTESEDISAAGLASWPTTQVVRAIAQGRDEKGKDLSPWMPAWSMSTRDLDDLVDYLKTAP